MKTSLVKPRRQRLAGATTVEFALIAPLLFALVFGLFSAATYVFEVQVANQAAQAAARWGVAAANFQGDPPAPQCPSSPPPDGMISAAQAAAGPFASSINKSTLQDLAAMPPASAGLVSGTYGCQIQVTIPYVSFGGFFNLGPTSITATAIDYVT
ncbi:MAG: TadE family protein [Candidatus Dormibacteria bacterium]